MPNPARGEVWLVDLGLAAKVRPCLVLNTAIEDHERALATVVAHTTKARGTRFEVEVQSRFLQVGVFDAQNLITVPNVKFVRRLGALSADQLSSVEEAVRRWLGL